MSGRELCYLTLAEQSRLIRDREVSPVEVAASALEQIDRIDGRVNSFITLLRDEAMASARDAESEIARGDYRGPLHGVPIALKDLYYTRGVRTTGGSRILRDFVPQEDATVVRLLKDAGAIVIGKTNMHEFAYGTLNTNPHYGDVHNPWDLGRVTGGSSGGSAAAVAAFMSAGALGSDTGGSIRIPAALCGITGLKPTYGRVSRYGAIPCAWSLDHVGPMTRTAEDAAMMLSVIAGWDPKDPASSKEPVPDYAALLLREVSGLKLAALREYVEDPQQPRVADAFQEAVRTLRGLGMTVDVVSVPQADAAVGASTAILQAEVTAYHEEWLRTRAEEYGSDVRVRLELGLLEAATDYVKGQRVRRVLIEQMLGLFRDYDALLCPTEVVTAPWLDRDTVPLGGQDEPKGPVLVRHTRLFNLTSLPALSVPCGFDDAGLPVALQIAGAPFSEATTLAIAHAYQQATDWHKRVPPVAAR